jgi:NAD(P)H dehydrogenase (quinone)
VLRYLAPALASGTLAAPADGKVSWTTHHDLADAAAVALTEPARLRGITAPLTAGVAHDMLDIARIASEVTGKRIERVVVSDDELRASMEAQQLPELAITMTLGLFQAARRGDFAATDPQLEALIGRPPQTVRDVIPR